jgi:hypothetical protein
MLGEKQVIVAEVKDCVASGRDYGLVPIHFAVTRALRAVKKDHPGVASRHFASRPPDSVCHTVTDDDHF